MLQRSIFSSDYMLRPLHHMRTLDLLLGIWGIVWITVLLYFCLRLPIQTDEVAWAFVNHRAILDNFDSMTLYPQCGASVFPLRIPIVAVVPAAINHLLYSGVSDPLVYRYVGVARLLLVIGLLVGVVRYLFPTRRDQLFSLAGMSACLSLDSTVLSLAMARPEQSLLLGILLILSLTFYAPRLSGHRWLSGFAAVLFLMTVLQTCFAHSKAGALIPFFALASIFFIKQISERLWVQIVFPVLTLSLGTSLLNYWLERLACPDSIEVQQMLYNFSLPPLRLLSDPIAFLSQALVNFSLAVSNDLVIFPDELSSSWFKIVVAEPIVSLALVGAWSGFALRVGVLIHILVRTHLVWIVTRPRQVLAVVRRGLSERFFSSEGMRCSLALSLVGALLAFCVFLGSTRSFYLSALEVPLLLLVYLLLLGPGVFSSRSARMIGGGTIVAGVVGLALSTVLAAGADELSQRGRVLSFSMPDYQSKVGIIEELAAECGISRAGSRHVVLDDSTYGVFSRAVLPLHIHYASDRYYRYEDQHSVEDVNRFMALLANVESAGVVVDCRNLPAILNAYARASEGFCCLSNEAIHAYRDATSEQKK